MTQITPSTLTAFVSSCSRLIEVMEAKREGCSLPEGKRKVLALLSSVSHTAPCSAMGWVTALKLRSVSKKPIMEVKEEKAVKYVIHSYLK